MAKCSLCKKSAADVSTGRYIRVDVDGKTVLVCIARRQSKDNERSAFVAGPHKPDDFADLIPSAAKEVIIRWNPPNVENRQAPGRLQHARFLIQDGAQTTAEAVAHLVQLQAYALNQLML